MPSSSNPFNLVSAALLAFCGVPCVILGTVGVLSDTGPMRPVLGLLAVSGLLMIGGAVQAVLAWRRAERRERGHEAALYQAVRGHEPALPQPPAPTAAAPPAEPAARTEPPASGAREADAEVLAHWTYAPDEWSEYARQELRFRRGEALSVGLGVVVLGVLLLVYRRDAEYGVALGVAGVVGAIIYAGRLLQARSAHAANTATRGGEVVISPRAVVLNGRYHVLQDDRFHFAGVRLLDEEDPPVLEFSVVWSTRSGRADEQVYVPVPRGREEEARALAASFPRRPA
ncbi:MAG TPA: hypothetical protein VHG51_16220 [Longimicrobiaceae bacterium]|nr:hypothetical protein [Longimicrobiaceae bacterium]